MTNEPDLVRTACLQLATSTGAMQAAAKMYLRLAEQVDDRKDRTAFLECAAFYAQLAEWSGTGQQQAFSQRKKLNGHW